LCCNYNLLHGSLSNDLKIESLDEALLSNNPKETPSGNSKKRKAEQDDITFVKLTREQLVGMSSLEFEERVRLLQNMRPLTLPEEEEIKRQRKLIKNREYAQTSRVKKRETLSSLQVQLTAVNTENQIFKSHITNLTQQVQYLQIENHQLRMMLSSYSVAPPAKSQETVLYQQQQYPQTYNNTLLTPPPTSLQSSPESCIYSEIYSPSLSNDDNDLLGVITSDSDEISLPIDFINDKGFFSDNADQFSFETGKNWVTDNYTTGLCLLVILFSFGLFFNGLLFEGISVMVSPSVVGSLSTTTSRTLFHMKEDISIELEEMNISDIPVSSLDTNSNCNESVVDGVKKNKSDQLDTNNNSIYTISSYL